MIQFDNNGHVTIKRTDKTLMARVMAPKVQGVPVLPRAVVSTFDHGGNATLLKVRTVEPIKGRQGVTGDVVDAVTGMPCRDENGKISRSWRYLSQITHVVKPAK